MTETDDVGGCNCGADIRPSKKGAPESIKKRHSLQKNVIVICCHNVIINNVMITIGVRRHWNRKCVVRTRKKPSLWKRPYHCDYPKNKSIYFWYSSDGKSTTKRYIRKNDNSHHNHNITLTKKPTHQWLIKIEAQSPSCTIWRNKNSGYYSNQKFRVEPCYLLTK